MTRAYEQQRRDAAPVTEFASAAPIAYWRGSLSGMLKYRCLEQSQRYMVCRTSLSHPQLIDARIVPHDTLDPLVEQSLKEISALAPRDPFERCINFRYQLDIDGFSSSWVGLFRKLLLGRPVLKISSDFDYRQWYYDDLVPWEHFVPIAQDCSDLPQIVEQLNNSPDDASRIGLAGQRLALSLAYESQIDRAISTIHNFSL